MKKLLITGASGFIGGFIVEKALSMGMEVFAVVRKSSNRKYLQDERIKFIELSLPSPDQLLQEIEREVAGHGGWDYVIHNAGITKANQNEEFFKVNSELTKHFIDALIKAKAVKQKFLFVSSLAAAGPGKNLEQQILIDQDPAPVTSYGKSKLEAERYLQSKEDFPYLILRPTAVFGPRDTELFTLFNLINKGFEFYIGTDEQRLSFIYVKDLVDMILAGLQSDQANKIYYISDGNSYLIRDFVAMIKKATKKRTIKVIVPAAIVSFIALFLEKLLSLFGQIPALNSEKMAELTSMNWTCDMSPYFNDISLRPQYDLQTAIDESVEWYKSEKWI